MHFQKGKSLSMDSKQLVIVLLSGRAQTPLNKKTQKIQMSRKVAAILISEKEIGTWHGIFLVLDIYKDK